jgi:DNA-3-methyladenine glycosylase
MPGASTASAVREVLAGPALEVAPLLLGWTLTHESAAGTVGVALTEVEAYLGVDDPASHAFSGRTDRNQVMFGPAGHLYVYRSHGLHWCCNVVTGTVGQPSAVLLRAGRIVSGVELAEGRRGDGVVAARLARGPGCLCRALGIGGTHNGVDLATDSRLRLTPGARPTKVMQGPRVGVSKAHDRPWRFWICGEPTVSAYRRSPKAPDN